MDTTAALSTGLSAGRIALGLGLMLAPARFGGLWIGPAATEGPTQIVVRGLGVRDVALGVATIGSLQATGTDGAGFTALTGLGVLCDVVDTVATKGSASEIPGRGIASMAVAAAAAAVGVATLTLARSQSDS
jgi:hypothetical protein